MTLNGSNNDVLVGCQEKVSQFGTLPKKTLTPATGRRNCGILENRLGTAHNQTCLGLVKIYTRTRQTRTRRKIFGLELGSDSPNQAGLGIGLAFLGLAWTRPALLPRYLPTVSKF